MNDSDQGSNKINGGQFVIISDKNSSGKEKDALLSQIDEENSIDESQSNRLIRNEILKSSYSGYCSGRNIRSMSY